MIPYDGGWFLDPITLVLQIGTFIMVGAVVIIVARIVKGK